MIRTKAQTLVEPILQVTNLFNVNKLNRYIKHNKYSNQQGVLCNEHHLEEGRMITTKKRSNRSLLQLVLTIHSYKNKSRKQFKKNTNCHNKKIHRFKEQGVIGISHPRRKLYEKRYQHRLNKRSNREKSNTQGSQKIEVVKRNKFIVELNHQQIAMVEDPIKFHPYEVNQNLQAK